MGPPLRTTRSICSSLPSPSPNSRPYTPSPHPLHIHLATSTPITTPHFDDNASSYCVPAIDTIYTSAPSFPLFFSSSIPPPHMPSLSLSPPLPPPIHLYTPPSPLSLRPRKPKNPHAHPCTHDRCTRPPSRPIRPASHRAKAVPPPNPLCLPSLAKKDTTSQRKEKKKH